MENRRSRLNLLGYIYIMVLVNTYITGINATPCTDQTDLDNFVSVQKMCINETTDHPRLVIDTWGTGDPDVYSCTCTVILLPGSAPPWGYTTVSVKEYPGAEQTASCGSTLRMSSTTSNVSTEIGCSSIPVTLANDFMTSDKLTLTLSRSNASTPWQSGHCILITQVVLSYGLSMTCKSPQKSALQQTSTDATPPIQTTATATFKSMETSLTTQTQQSRETTTTQQSREISTFNITNSEMTTTMQKICVQQSHLQQGYPLSAVVAPLVVTTVLIIVSVAAHVILYRRRLALMKKPETVMMSSNPVHYDSLDLSRVEPPNLYADTSTGQMYVNTAI